MTADPSGDPTPGPHRAKRGAVVVRYGAAAGLAIAFTCGALLFTRDPVPLALWALFVGTIGATACRNASDVASGALAQCVVLACLASAGVGLVCGAYALACGALCRAVRGPRLESLAAVIAIAWLAWPVWAGTFAVSRFEAATIQHLIDVHPPTVVNGLLRPDDPWTHRPLGYSLTPLGQDVSFAMPTHAGWCVLFYAGVACAAVAWRAVRRAA